MNRLPVCRSSRILCFCQSPWTIFWTRNGIEETLVPGMLDLVSEDESSEFQESARRFR
jgi:hypothetical protein